MNCICCEDKKFQTRSDGIKIPCPACQCYCKPLYVPLDVTRKLRIRGDERYEVKIWFSDEKGIYGGCRMQGCHLGLDHWIMKSWQLNGLAAMKSQKVGHFDLLYEKE